MFVYVTSGVDQISIFFSVYCKVTVQYPIKFYARWQFILLNYVFILYICSRYISFVNVWFKKQSNNIYFIFKKETYWFPKRPIHSSLFREPNKKFIRFVNWTISRLLRIYNIHYIIIMVVEHNAHKKNSFINSIVFNSIHLSAYNKMHKKKVVLVYY